MRQCGSTVEQLICNQWVAGSIPVTGSIETAGQDAKVLTFYFSRSIKKSGKNGLKTGDIVPTSYRMHARCMPGCIEEHEQQHGTKTMPDAH